MKKNFIRTIAFLMMLALLCTGFAGCLKDEDKPAAEPAPPAASDAGGSDEPAPPETADPAETDEPQETAAPPETAAPLEPAPSAPVTPVDMSTPGGVVIVGVVNKDDEGWYIAPEQPLNVEFEYFLDEPSYFEGVTRVNLYDPAEDGIEKSLYLGMTVTIEGAFNFYRSYFDRLYLLPYRITIGKNAEQSYAAPELAAPEAPENLYDPSLPLPKYMLSMTEDGHYIYNAFMLSTETLELMGNDFTYFYLDFVDAFLNYRSECPCPDKNYAEMLSTIIYYEFPMFNACAEPFEFAKQYDPETESVSIVYKYDEETHLQVINEFMTAANEFLATTSPEQSEQEKARNIYHELCTRVTYDDSALVDFERKDSWYAYLNKSGVCLTFANVYNQMLTQVGIESTLVHCEYTPTLGHAWTAAKLDGGWYLCDPTFELSYMDGSAYRYFGQTYEQRANDVGTEDMSVGRYFRSPLDPAMISASPLNFN